MPIQASAGIPFFCVLTMVLTTGNTPVKQQNARILKMLEQAIEQDGIVNIFEQAGQKNREISFLSEEYMEQVLKKKHKNIAAEMLRNLLENNIRVFRDWSCQSSAFLSEDAGSHEAV